MRIKNVIVTGALLLASSGLALAQQAQLAQSAQQGQTDVVQTQGPFVGTLDLSFRASDMTGDVARFQRYRDIRDQGAGLNLKFKRDAGTWVFNLGAKNVGYEDQNFTALFRSGKAKASLEWNQVPLFYGASDMLRTPYSTQVSGGVATLTLPGGTQAAVQNSGAVGVALNVAQLGQSIYLAAAKGVEVKSRRNTLDVNLVVQATKELDVKFALNSYKKEGTQPWGASFAFNDAIELPLPIDQRTTNVEAAAEWANQKGMFRVGYEGSYFDNNISTLVWANPYRATDSTHASAYSNAALGGSSLGRMPLSPTNHANGVSASGLIKLPERTSINASFGVADWKQNEPLLPYSINPAVPVIPLERSTAEAEARIISGNVNFVTRPTNYFGLTARFRYSDRNNKTALFDATEYIRFDGVMEETGGENEPVSIKRQSFNVDASFTPLAYAAFRLGYGREASDYTYRMFSSSTENTFRASIDSIGSPFVTVRAMFEHANRDGTFEPHVLVEAGQQPDMRQYDVANRRRDRGTLLVDVTPNAFVGFSASIAAGRDDYPDQGFGLLNNKNQAYTVGIDLTPKEQIALGLSFGREKYEALQQSRNANPSGDYGSWMDPNRIWNVKNEETVDSYGAYLDLIKALPKTEIRIGYDYNRSDNGFLFGGPRIQELLTGRAITPGAPNPCAVGVTSCFEPLPNVMNKWQHALVDLRYFVTPKVGIGGGYFFDKYDVSDFASPSLNGNLTTPRYDPLGELYLGYALRPFKAHTGFLRLIYLF